MSRLVIFDFEVFAHDTLLGAMELHNDGSISVCQMWDLDEIRQFYDCHKDDTIFIGWNNSIYDDLILEAVVKGANEEELKRLNEDMIRGGKRHWKTLPFLSYDVMKNYTMGTSLKATEGACGRSIDETEVDFFLNRKLTDEEKKLTESYNLSDLEQTKIDFENAKYQFELRLQIINTFKMNPVTSLNATGTTIAARALGSKHVHGIDKMVVDPIVYSTLKLENKELWDYYLNNKFRTSEKLDITVGNAEIRIGSGGAHSAIKKYHTDKFLYFDVSGYYNLVMLNYDLLPRTMPKESKELYRFMYEEQLRLKKIDPYKRAVYKTILLSVFGAMMNEHTDFYDPWHGLLVTITGQLFIVDLIEKLKDLVTVIQTNTDGIMVEPHNWDDKNKIIDIVKEWMNRTGFVIKIEEKYDLYQRDVNCYICRDAEGNVDKKGNRFFNWWIETCCDSSIPYIISKALQDYLMKGILPEQTINNNINELKWYQYIAKKRSYNYVTYDTVDMNGNKESKRVQAVNRAFPCKYNEVVGSLVKHKDDKKSRIPNLPPNVFICNGALDEYKEQIIDMIDLQYYINETYKYLQEFID